MLDNSFSEQIESAAENAEIVFKVTLVLTFFLNFVLSGGAIYVLALIRSL